MIMIVFMISDLPWLMCDNKDSTCCDYDGADVENDDIALALQFPTSDDYDDDDEYDDDDDEKDDIAKGGATISQQDRSGFQGGAQIQQIPLWQIIN